MAEQFPAEPIQARHCSDNQKSADIALPSLRHPTKPFFPARGVDRRPKREPALIEAAIYNPLENMGNERVPIGPDRDPCLGKDSTHDQ